MFKLLLISLMLGATPAEITQSTVKVDYRFDDNVLVGSGTIIETTDVSFSVLTCSHCVRHHAPKGKSKIILQDGRSYPATIIKIDPDRDLCLLKSNFKIEIKPSEFADDDYKPGTKIQVSGFSAGKFYSLRNGTVTNDFGWKVIDGDKVVSQILNVYAVQGDSGGGVFRDGKQIGVLWGGTPGGIYVNRMDTIKSFLK